MINRQYGRTLQAAAQEVDRDLTGSGGAIILLPEVLDAFIHFPAGLVPVIMNLFIKKQEFVVYFQIVVRPGDLGPQISRLKGGRDAEARVPKVDARLGRRPGDRRRLNVQRAPPPDQMAGPGQQNRARALEKLIGNVYFKHGYAHDSTIGY